MLVTILSINTLILHARPRALKARSAEFDVDAKLCMIVTCATMRRLAYIIAYIKMLGVLFNRRRTKIKFILT